MFVMGKLLAVIPFTSCHCSSALSAVPTKINEIQIQRENRTEVENTKYIKQSSELKYKFKYCSLLEYLYTTHFLLHYI